MNKQLSLFDLPQSDDRPLPLIVADKWGFALSYIDTDNNVEHYLYSVQDWLLGLHVGKNRVRKYWADLKKQLSDSDGQLSIEQLPYQATDGKFYQMDFTDHRGLYLIPQTMRPVEKRANLKGVLGDIYRYLADAGVFTDRARREPAQVAKELTARAKGIQARNSMTAAAQDTKDDKRPFYGILTDAQYEKLLGRKKREIVALLGMTPQEASHFRDQLGEQALDALRMAEGAAAVKMRNAPRPLTHEEQLDIVVMCAEIVAPSYHKLTEYLQVDNVRNQPMLTGGVR